MTDQAPILLIHGAWHGAWCWSQLTPLLERSGCRVLAPDLPGHGTDGTALSRVSLQRYVDALAAVVHDTETPWIVVAHSMAGLPASVLAQQHPELFSSLIYLNAYIPSDGDSVFGIMQSLLPDSEISQAMSFSTDRRVVTLPRDSIIPLFYQFSDPALQQVALNAVAPQASLPLNQRASLTSDRFGLVRKVAIGTEHDRVIPPGLLQAMLRRQPCDEYIRLEGDHSLFFSDPGILAQLILAQ